MLPYYPGLRFKQGEYVAAGKLPADVQRYVEPRFVLPSLKEPDPALDRPLTLDEIAYLTGDRVGKHWPLRRAFFWTRTLSRATLEMWRSSVSSVLYGAGTHRWSRWLD
jgi:hypothetical protein